MMNATMTQQPDVNSSISADAYNVNLQNFPIFEEMPPTTNHQTFPMEKLPPNDPSLRTVSSAPDNYSNNGYYQQHYYYPSYQFSQGARSAPFYNNYQHYYKGKEKEKQSEKQTQSEYMKYLIKQVRQLTQERNEMQQTISLLQKKIGTKKLLEEDFHSFLSRIEFPEWITDEEKRLCLNKLFVNETQKISHQLKEAKLARRQQASKNLMLETKIIQLTDDISALREYLEQEKHRNYLESVNHNKNLAAKLASKHHKNDRICNKNDKYNDNIDKMDYPPENIIIQNLIRTQIEFYFSDFNLKRDKRLLDQLCSDRIGFLKIDSVMNLTRVRQLSSHRNQVINSLKHSKFLSLTQDNEWIGRLGFERPQEKQFPFRRTVFVFGLPMDSDEKYVTEMLSPFGKLSKVKFDHGPDTLDRLVAENMLKEIKVYKYRDLNTRISYVYRQEIMVGGSAEYNCNKCNKIKQCDEGFYETNSYQVLICLQCAAASAEGILDKCKSAGDNERMIMLLCGKPPRDTNKTKTALAVFTSQRQASKCVYVRSRIAFDGCFTTHYHHYSKLKKEIALTLQPFADKLREIPPRRVLHAITANKLSDKGNVYHLGASTQPLGFEDFRTNRIEPPKLHHNISPESLPLESLSSHSEASDLDIVKGTTLMSSHTADGIQLPKTPPKLKNDFISDNNNKYNSPKLKKSSAGSLTAPVVGGSGEIYLMRAAYNKVNSSTHESFVDNKK